MSLLTGIYSPKGINVPDPIQSICTRWGSDPLSYGSYSHVRVKSSGRDYDTLSETVGGRLFFAGEATTRQYPATMHGAFLSGLREAARILRVRRGMQNSLRKSISRNAEQCNSMLVDLFKRPDLVFGKFSFVCNPLIEDPKSMGILRVAFDSPGDDLDNELEKNFQQSPSLPLQLYTEISRQQVDDLQKVTGTDKDKLSYLTRDLGLKLVGSGSLANYSSSLISSIANPRKGRGRYKIVAAKQFSSV